MLDYFKVSSPFWREGKRKGEINSPLHPPSFFLCFRKCFHKSKPCSPIRIFHYSPPPQKFLLVLRWRRQQRRKEENKEIVSNKQMLSSSQLGMNHRLSCSETDVPLLSKIPLSPCSGLGPPARTPPSRSRPLVL